MESPQDIDEAMDFSAAACPSGAPRSGTANFLKLYLKFAAPRSNPFHS
jgi:hypothetical protein